MPRATLLVLLALAGCGPSALAVRMPDPPPPVIETSLHTVPLRSGKQGYATGGNFVAAEPGRHDPPFIAQSTNLEFAEYDQVALALGRVEETPARRAALEELAGRLEARGWHRDGNTGPWYGWRFTR